MRRPALTALVLAVVAMHAAGLWLLVVATKPHGSIAGPPKRIAMEVVQVVPPVKAEPPARLKEAVPRAPALRPATRRSTIATRDNSITAPTAPTAAAEPPQTTSLPPLILHSESTRRALRDVGRERSFADRASQDLNGSPRPAFDSRLSAGVAGAAHGDCMKGQFKGSNMGLLSLPALALAAAQGECAR